jgi:hypothetical protein
MPKLSTHLAKILVRVATLFILIFMHFLIKVNQYSDQNCQKTTGELIIWCGFTFFCL